MPLSAFPNVVAIGGHYLKYLKHPANWDDITIQSEFEDGGVDFNVRAASPPQRWTFEFGGLNDTQAKVLDDHYADAHGQLLGFSFTEPRDVPWSHTTGSTYTDVHYESFEKDHDKVWIQSRKITLIKRPA
jgi:hypothetical protein